MPRRVALRNQLRVALWNWNQPLSVFTEEKDPAKAVKDFSKRIRGLVKLQRNYAALCGEEALARLIREVQHSVSLELLARPIETNFERAPIGDSFLERCLRGKPRWEWVLRLSTHDLADCGVPVPKAKGIREILNDRREFQVA